MKAVILAGGEGTRLRPLTYTRPKPFVPVGLRPCVDYVLESVKKAGVTEVIVTTYYKPQDLIKHLGGGTRLGLDVVYSVEDDARGTAGAVKKVAGFLDDTFIVASGDVFADVDVAALVKFHKEKGAIATMALTEVDDPTQFGIVGVNDDGRITRFKEKPKTQDEIFSHLINAGIYVLEPEALQHVPERGTFDFSKELFPLLLEKSEGLYAHKLNGTWVDVGRPHDLIAATVILAEREGGLLKQEGAEISRSARVSTSAIHAGAVIGNDATVDRCIILPNARVETGAVVRDTILGEHSRVGAGARVTTSVLGDHATVSEKAVVTDRKLDPEETVDA